MKSTVEQTSAPAFDNRRKSFRHQSVQADVMIGRKIYRVVDWSTGGVSFESAAQDNELARQVQSDFFSAAFQGGDVVVMTLLFHFPHETVAIRQNARIIRQSAGGSAASFTALSARTRREFERVIDSLNAETFLGSQVA